MKITLTITLIFFFTFFPAQNKIWIIGTAHEERNYINQDSLTFALNKIKPDLILIELEQKHFNKDFKFNLDEYPDLISTNENKAVYKYQNENKILVRPFDIEGRNEFYKKENFREKENKMFGEIFNLYKHNQLNEQSKMDFEILLAYLSNYSELKFSSLRESNSDVATRFLMLKNKVNYDLMISIVKNTKQLKKWIKFAELRKSFWEDRNNAMFEKIKYYSKEFPSKKIVVLVGNDHKYFLQNLLTENKFEVKNYYE